MPSLRNETVAGVTLSRDSVFFSVSVMRKESHRLRIRHQRTQKLTFGCLVTRKNKKCEFNMNVVSGNNGWVLQLTLTRMCKSHTDPRFVISLSNNVHLGGEFFNCCKHWHLLGNARSFMSFNDYWKSRERNKQQLYLNVKFFVLPKSEVNKNISLEKWIWLQLIDV